MPGAQRLAQNHQRTCCAHLKQGLRMQMSDGWDLVRESCQKAKALSYVLGLSFRECASSPSMYPYVEKKLCLPEARLAHADA